VRALPSREEEPRRPSAVFSWWRASPPQGAKRGVERLHVLNCGEGVAGDVSRWSPGVNVAQSMEFVDNCYLLRHGEGWFLWDTGGTDAIAVMPDGQPPADPRLTHWRRPRTLASQLDELGVKPSDVRFVAVSHAHADHIGTSSCRSTSEDRPLPGRTGARRSADTPPSRRPRRSVWRPRRSTR
jgi:hypothetical protein